MKAFKNKVEDFFSRKATEANAKLDNWEEALKKIDNVKREQQMQKMEDLVFDQKMRRLEQIAKSGTTNSFSWGQTLTNLATWGILAFSILNFAHGVEIQANTVQLSEQLQTVLTAVLSAKPILKAIQLLTKQIKTSTLLSTIQNQSKQNSKPAIDDSIVKDVKVGPPTTNSTSGGAAIPADSSPVDLTEWV